MKCYHVSPASRYDSGDTHLFGSWEKAVAYCRSQGAGHFTNFLLCAPRNTHLAISGAYRDKERLFDIYEMPVE